MQRSRDASSGAPDERRERWVSRLRHRISRTLADLDYYDAEFERSGFRGPINRYRNPQRDFEYLRQFEGRKIEQPSLFIGGERDLVLSMLGKGDLMAIMGAEMPNLRGADVLPGGGHWTQQERPQEVNDRLLPWLKSL